MNKLPLIDLEKILLLSTVHIYWLDSNNVYQGCNDLQAKSAGLSSRFDIVGKRNSELPWNKNYPDIVEQLDRINMEVIKGGVPKVIEESAMFLDGTRGVFLSHKLPLKNKKGKVTGLLGISIDITSQKEQQEKLRDEKERAEFTLEYIIAHMPAHVYWKDERGIYLGSNDLQAQSLGLSSAKEVVGKTDFELPWKKENAKMFRDNDLEVMKTGIMKTVEEQATVAGEPATVLSQKLPLKDKKGKVAGVVGISLDITALKKAKEELKQAKEKAELASKAKTDFLDNMRHDLRTSLNGIQGFSELIRDEVHDKRVSEYAANLVASCRALTNIHNQILHAIHVFSGDIPFYKSKFDLCGKLKQIVNLNLAKAGEKGLKLDLSCDEAIPKYLVGDCRRLTGIAQELVTNALKYTDRGSVSVSVVLESKQDAKVVVKFTVQDTGIGIPEDKKQEIFTRFGRLTPSYEGKYIGLGLGLSVAKQLIDDLGGEIYVESEPNKGSTFICYMPFVEALSNDATGMDDTLDLQLDDNIRAKLVETKPMRAMKGKGYDILLVEDDAVSAKVAYLICNNMGQNLEIARNGKEALQKAKLKDYDLIFMDVGLPDISGNEITRKIRIGEKATGRHVPIAALTAHVDNESKQQCIESGMDAVLSKPISIQKVTDMLDAFIPGSAKKEAKKTEVKKAKQVKDSELLKIEGKVLDLDYIKQHLGYDDAIIDKLLKVAPKAFMEDGKRLLDAYKQKDWPAARDAAHKMNGGAGYIGATRLKETCTRLEAYIRANKTELAGELCELVLKENKEVLAAIKKKFE